MVTQPSASLRGGELRQLWATIGHRFTDFSFGQIGVDTVVTLMRCGSCGFRYFNPAFAGGGQFYAELGGEDYYVQERPEFSRMHAILAKAQEAGRVLDIGCGDGAFLDKCRLIGWSTFGTELNSGAAERASAKGHSVLDGTLAKLGERAEAGSFDAVTAFQVFEHVPDPVRMLNTCRTLVKPGGLIAMSVPFESGVYKLAPLDPHQWPPHHLSRWRKADLRTLGRLANVQVLSVVADVLYGSALEYFLKLSQGLEQAINSPHRLLTRPFVPEIASLLYRKTGMKYLLPRWGQSVFALFRRSS